MIGRMLATLAVLAACAACSASGEEAGERRDRPALSGPESRDVLVHGRVLDDGKPVADAAVTIQVWPEDMDEIEVGDTIDMFDATMSTDDEGRYVVLVDPRELESRYFGGSDFVNFDVLVGADGRMTSWSTTTYLIGAGRIWRSDPEARTGDRALELRFDLSKQTVETTTSTGETTREDLTVNEVDIAP